MILNYNTIEEEKGDNMDEIENESIQKEKNKIGRPKIWDEHKAEDLTKKLLEWAEKTNSFAIIQFCKENKLAPQRYYELIKKSEIFSDASTYARLCIGSRIVENINSKEHVCHPAFFNKYIRSNDIFLDNHLKENEKNFSQELGEKVVKIIDFAKYKKEYEDKK